MDLENNIKIALICDFQKTNLGWFDSEGVLASAEQDNTFDELKFTDSPSWAKAAILYLLDKKLLGNDKVIGELLKTILFHKTNEELANDFAYILSADFDKTLARIEDSKVHAIIKETIERILSYSEDIKPFAIKELL